MYSAVPVRARINLGTRKIMWNDTPHYYMWWPASNPCPHSWYLGSSCGWLRGWGSGGVDRLHLHQSPEDTAFAKSLGVVGILRRPRAKGQVQRCGWRYCEVSGTSGDTWKGLQGWVGVEFGSECGTVWGWGKRIMTSGTPYLNLQQWFHWTGMRSKVSLRRWMDSQC